jgi:hypothetical protein
MSLITYLGVGRFANRRDWIALNQPSVLKRQRVLGQLAMIVAFHAGVNDSKHLR